jgi:hypothetical protein
MGGSWERLIGVSRRILDSLLLQHKSRNLTHEVLTTFMAEVCAIVNSRPLIPVSTDPEDPIVLSPAMLLTQKTATSGEHLPNLGFKDMYKAQWKFVQVLADEFWNKWRHQYLSTLQARKKWENELPNFKEGDVVLLKEQDCNRIYWPLGVITRVFPSGDGIVRKLEVRIIRDGKPVTYVRPITEIVSLCINE